MEYTGKLYGKIGRRYIPLTLTSEDVDRLVQWKKEAMQVLAEWERVWVAAGSPGTLGQSKAVAVLNFINDLSTATPRKETKNQSNTNE